MRVGEWGKPKGANRVNQRKIRVIAQAPPPMRDAPGKRAFPYMSREHVQTNLDRLGKVRN
jgi:hypothetical protein